MTDPRYTDRPYNDPPPANSNVRGERGNTAMWGWLAGFAIVILIAFILAAGWNGNVQTASKAPRATTGSGVITQPIPRPATTGSGTGAPAMTPHAPATPSTAPTIK